MAIVRIPTPLRKLTGGAEEVQARASRSASSSASSRSGIPASRSASATRTGAVRRFVNIFVKDEDIRFLQNLETPLGDKDEVSIVPAIAGG